jgi:hypothetical protein
MDTGGAAFHGARQRGRRLLQETNGVDQSLWAELAREFAAEQLIELIMLAGLYHAVSYVINAVGIPREPFAPPFPAIA